MSKTISLNDHFLLATVHLKKVTICATLGGKFTVTCKIIYPSADRHNTWVKVQNFQNPELSKLQS